MKATKTSRPFKQTVLILILLVASIVQPCISFAQYRGFDGWKAQWITHTFPPASENSWTIFAKDVDLTTAPQSLTARIAVDSKYWLWVNGQMVVFEGELKRGPTPNDTYYDAVEIAPFLKQGKNSIRVLVWYWARDGYCHKSSGQMGLLFDAQSNGTTILSDTSWRSLFHPAFGNTSDPIPNYRLPEYNIKFYGNQDTVAWQQPSAAERWAAVSAIGNAGAAPWNRLWERPFPQWKNSGLVAYANRVSFPFVSDGTPVVMQLPKNITITPYLKIEAPEGLLIDMRTDNYRGGSEYNLRSEYVTKAGVQEFETYGYVNGHQVIYTIPKGVKVLDLKYRRTSFPTEIIGSFHCDNEDLNTLWYKSANTMDVNMRDAIQDPDRERAQWWGDAVTILGEIFYTCDNNGKKAVQKAMSNLVEWQRPDSTLYSPVPSGEVHQELPTQMLAAVSKYGFWRYFQYTGDTVMMRYVYPHVKKYLAVWQTNNDGLVVHRNGEWNWFDWGSNIDEAVNENAWFYMALEGARDMALVVGKPEDAAAYETKMQKLKVGFHQRFWTGTAFRSPEYKGETDDRAQGLAVAAGLADSASYEAIKAVLRKEFHAGPYIEKYIVESLLLMGDPQAALHRLTTRYRRMIDSKLTTLWEGWDIGSAVYGGGSYNHGWSGGPLTLMHEYFAGIYPLTAGYKMIAVKPDLKTLSSIQCTSPTLQGLVILNAKAINGSANIDLTVPANSQAILEFPFLGRPPSRIQINGKHYDYRSGSKYEKQGIKFLQYNNKKLTIQLSPAKWVVHG